MGQEIRTQIEGMLKENKPQHFTFNEVISDTFDRTFEQSGAYADQDRMYDYSKRKDMNRDIPSPSRFHKCDMSIEKELRKLEERLIHKEIELKAHCEKAIKDLKYCEQKYREKIQIDHLHFENSQQLLKQSHEDEMRKVNEEIAQVKSDARLVIDFIRRKASQAIAEESTKVEYQKKSMGKKMEAIEAEMKKKFNDHLISLEEEVRNVVNNEKRKVMNSKILPSPPPPTNVCLFSKPKMNSSPMKKKIDISIPSDGSEVQCLYSDDSISSCKSGEMRNTTGLENEHDILKRRVQELEKWTDTLTLALRTGAKMKKSNMTSS